MIVFQNYFNQGWVNWVRTLIVKNIDFQINLHRYL
jgi:hypothetical protein